MKSTCNANGVWATHQKFREIQIWAFRDENRDGVGYHTCCTTLFISFAAQKEITAHSRRRDKQIDTQRHALEPKVRQGRPSFYSYRGSAILPQDFIRQIRNQSCTVTTAAASTSCHLQVGGAPVSFLDIRFLFSLLQHYLCSPCMISVQTKCSGKAGVGCCCPSTEIVIRARAIP